MEADLEGEAPVEPDVRLAEPERELVGLRGERDRLAATILERRSALLLKRVELLDLDLEIAALEQLLRSWFAESWQTRRASVASREAAGVFNRPSSPFGLDGLTALVAHGSSRGAGW